MQSGGEVLMTDYFDVLDIFQKKRMTRSDAETDWRKLLSDPNLGKGEKGLNPDFRTRVERREDGIKRWFEEVGPCQQAVRATADIKSAADDEAFENLAGQMDDTSDFGHERFRALANTSGLPRESLHRRRGLATVMPAAPPSRLRMQGGSAALVQAVWPPGDRWPSMSGPWLCGSRPPTSPSPP